MKIVFDTNVILDAIVAGRPDNAYAKKLIICIAEEKAEGVITANSVTDIYYVARKTLGDAGACGAVMNLMTVFSVASIGEKDCHNALTLPMNDFKNALLAVCAKREGADYIVSRDAGFIASAGSPVLVIPPAKALEIILGKEGEA